MFVVEFILSAIWAVTLALIFLFHWETILAACGVILAVLAISNLISRPVR